MEIPATTFDDFNIFMQWLSTQNIDTSSIPVVYDTVEAVKEYLKTQGYQFIYSKVNVISGIAKVTAADPANTTAISNRVVTDLVPVAGGAAGSYTTGKKTFAMLSKRIVLGSLVAVLGIDALLGSLQSHITELDESLEPFTTDGENVPVIVDENGKVFLDKRVIDGFRNSLIDIGVFNTGGAESTMQVGDTITAVTSSPDIVNYLLDQMATGLDEFWATYDPVWYGTFRTKIVEVVNTMKQQTFPTLPTGHAYALRWVAVGSSNTQHYLILYTIDLDLDNHTRTVNSTSYASSSMYPRPTSYKQVYPSNYIKPSATGIRVGFYGNARGLSSSVQITVNTSYNTSGFTTLGTNTCDKYAFFEAGASSDYTSVAMNMIIKGALPGVTPKVPDVGDPTKDLSTIFPDWSANGFTVPTPTNSLDDKTEYLPVSMTNTDPLSQDIVSDDTDQEGNTSEATQTAMLEKLMEMYQELLRQNNPDATQTVTIEVGDSGDTPPYNPPLISGASNGLWTIYNPTLSEVQQFGGWLWSSSIIDQIIRQFNSPIDAVIGFMSLYATPITGERKTIKAGFLDSPVSAKEVTNQYITIDCGNVEVSEYYHTAIDYNRSQISIYLPFIGIVPLDVSVVTGSTLNVTYRIDVLTGTCLAQIRVIKQNSDAVMYTFTGNCAVQLPMTASTYTGMVGTTIALGGSLLSAAMGNPAGIASGLLSAGKSAVQNLSGTARSGSLSSNAGALGIRIPYLIITHPTSYEASIYNQVYGYPTNIYQRLSDLGGYVRVKDIHLDTISCTKQELQMIYDRLHEGVILT